MNDARPAPLARFARALVCAALLGGLAIPAGAAPSPEQAASVRRILILLHGVEEEYREAFDASGRVVRPLEIEEARLLLAEARDHGQRLAAVAPPDLNATFAALAAALDARGPLAGVQARIETLRRALSEATGVIEDFLPASAPSAARGKQVFLTHCASCHGEQGAGDGPDAARLERPPADFRDPTFMRGETPADFFNVITVGKRLSAMPAWGDVLSKEERWDVVAHLWSIDVPVARLGEGQGVFLAHCASCHGALGDGRGPYAENLLTPPSDLTSPKTLASRTDATLHAAVTDGVAGTAMPAFGRVLTDEERWKAVAFVRTLSLGGVASVTTETDGAPDTVVRETGTDAAFAETRRLLAASRDAHRRGDPAAADLATDAYFRFEPVETLLKVRDPGVVQRVEEAFLALRAGLRQPSAAAEPLFEAASRALDGAEATAGFSADSWARFLQSAAIILREGFEVVLILGALIAYVVKSGNPGMRRPIYRGATLGLAASLATAALLMTVFRLTPGAAAILEGAALLLAAAVLFWVSYWIISKAEAERWQRYIQTKVKRALATGSGLALAAAAFLAVYREGFETVLFYQALLASAPAGDVTVGAGFVTGTGLLAIVYLVLARFGLRIPIRPFFLATGALLNYMAVVFAGQGVHELQEAAVVGITPVAWVPQVGFLGVFPTLETLLAQGVLLLLLAYGVVVTMRGGRQRKALEIETLAGEVRRLRELAEAMRAEVTGLKAVDEAARLGDRLEGLIGQVRALEARMAVGNGGR